MNKFFLTVVFALAGQLVSFAQTEEATTPSGRKVILYANGTWKYADQVKTVAPVKDREEKKKEPEKKPEPEITGVSADCTDIIEITEDRKTSVRTRRVKQMIIIGNESAKKEISISLQKGAKDVITATFRPVGAGDCIAEGNKINIVFTDGSKLDLTNDGFTNCRGESTANFGGPFGRKKALDMLLTKKIKTIKAWTQQGTVMVDLSAENQEQFLQFLNCLYKQ